MYNCSNAFHAAIANNNEQKALLIFSDCVFTDEDINIDRGITFNDNFNMEENLSIGQATSNETRFSLINRNRQLNGYAFGDFQMLIGVYLNSTTYSSNTGELIRCVDGSNTYIGYSTYPYLKRNGAAVSTQPSAPFTSILAYDGKVYCFCANGTYKVYTSSTGVDVTSSNVMNGFMQNKSAQWTGKGIQYGKDTHLMKVWQGGEIRNWEFCPWGCFTAERPKAPDKIQIDFTCYDYMLKFDKDMTEISINFPITIQNLFIALSDAVLGSNQYVLPSTFINGDAVINSRPDDFDNVTAREVLKWIAEAAASNARFNRDGKLILDWIRTGTGIVLGPGNYIEFNPYWYETKKVTKLYNRDTHGNTQKTCGSGDEGYLIQDNPLLKGVS